jgi:Tol biopolymer transport system component
VEFGAQPAWSPDSQWLAFSSYEGAMNAQSSLWLVRADGSERRQLTALGMPAGGHQMPAWSPDGARVVFMNFTGGFSTSLWTVRRSGTEPQLLLDASNVALDATGYPQFGPDGRTIYFLGAVAGGNRRLFRLAIDPTTFGPAGSPEPVLPFDESLPSGLAISAGGTAVYGLVDEDSNLWAVDWPASGSPTRLTDGRRNFRPAFSPDSLRIAYVNHEVGQGLTVWVMDAGSGRAEPLLPGRNGSSPQWRPDKTIVIRDDSSGGATFTSVDIATRRETPLPFDGRGKGEARVSPDGTTVVFHEIGKNGVLNLWTQSLASGARRQITFDREAISYPTWSPDGRLIAAEVKRGENTHIVVIPTNGGPPRQLTDEPGQSWPNAWSPDGEWIAFAGERVSVWNLWAVSSRTGEARQLTRYTAADGYIRWPAWSPRGDRIVFERNRRRGAIWMSTLE